MFASLQAKALALLIVVIISGGGSVFLASHYYFAPKIVTLTESLRDARTVAVGERAARTEVQRLCDAGNAAASRAADLNAAAQSAIDRANEELLRNAPASPDDADPLGDVFRQLQQQPTAPAASTGR